MDLLLDICHASLHDMRQVLNAAMQRQPELECEDVLYYATFSASCAGFHVSWLSY